jgi:hypothetical protein
LYKSADMDTDLAHESGKAPDATTQQINDLFDSVEVATTVGLNDFKRFLDHVPNRY